MTGTVEIEAVGTELAASGPVANVEAARAMAQALSSVLDTKDLTVLINGRKHVTAEALLAMASVAGCTVHIERTCHVGDGDRDGWEARCVVRAADGREVASAESMCTRAERTWSRRDDFALRSMAQTRAISKALRQLFSFVAVLAAGTGATTEAEETTEPAGPAWAEPANAEGIQATAEALAALLGAAGVTEPHEAVLAVGRRIRERCDGVVPVVIEQTLVDLAEAIWNARSSS